MRKRGVACYACRMKVLILAAGYGTRLERDIRNGGPELQSLIGVPKPLLPVSGKPLVSHWIDILRQCQETRDVFLVVCMHASCIKKKLNKVHISPTLATPLAGILHQNGACNA